MSELHSDALNEWRRAAAAGRRYTAKTALAVAIAVAAGVGVGILLGYKFHDETWVYANSRDDASWTVLWRVVLASVATTLTVLLATLGVLRPDLARGYRQRMRNLFGGW